MWNINYFVWFITFEFLFIGSFSNKIIMLKEDELAYRGKDPGAVKFGNFINYYSFHSPDERLENLHTSMFPASVENSIVCLDIGCNTGELTRKIYEYLKSTIYPNSNIHILGIDIDPVLIQRAKDHTKNTNISCIKSNVMDYEDREKIYQYLNSHKRIKFDIVFCFSVTMWIHLNNGDSNFLEFLKYLKENARTILIEPQPWKCYRNAQRRMKKSGSNFPLYESLQIRNNVETVIENTLTSNGLFKVYESPLSQWDRKIQSFHYYK